VKGIFSYANINTLFGIDLLSVNIKISDSDNFALHSQIEFFIICAVTLKYKCKGETVLKTIIFKMRRSGESKRKLEKNSSHPCHFSA
jgi:hypothetical protein